MTGSFLSNGLACFLCTGSWIHRRQSLLDGCREDLARMDGLTEHVSLCKLIMNIPSGQLRAS